MTPEATRRSSPDLDSQAGGRILPAPTLISHLSVAQNISFPWDVHGVELEAAYLELLLDTFALHPLREALPDELTEEQKFHVACVRALVGRPQVVTIFPSPHALQESAVADVRFLATELGQALAGAEAPVLRDSVPEEPDLPESLDDIAAPMQLSSLQAYLVEEAEKILHELPGPIVDQDDPFTPRFRPAEPQWDAD